MQLLALEVIWEIWNLIVIVENRSIGASISIDSTTNHYLDYNEMLLRKLKPKLINCSQKEDHVGGHH